MNALSNKRTLLLVFLSLLLTAVSGILGAIPLRMLRKNLEQSVYWGMSIALSVAVAFSGAYWLAASFFAISVLVGLFSFFHNQGFSFESSGLASASFVSLLTLFSLFFVDQKLKVNFIEGFKSQLTAYFSKSETFLEMNIEKMVNELVLQIPSGIFMALLLSLMLALYFEKRIMNLSQVKSRTQIYLSSFRVPDFLIFVFIMTLFGSFFSWPESFPGSYWIKTVSLNVLNVLVLLYFFQGLAVLATYYEVFKVKGLWRFALTLIIVTQLFLMLSLVGIADFWLDFRLRLMRKAIELNDKQI